MTIPEYLKILKTKPETLQFQDLISLIDEHYNFTETEFANGTTINLAGQNNGSCKLFSFAQIHKLNHDDTLNCFAQFYREDVVKNPTGSDHQNIRNFMTTSWDGIQFKGEALTLK